jgi:hypothetical protein
VAGTTTDPTDPRLGRGVDTERTEQHEVYLVLSPEERAKGFVRPVRQKYVHVGVRPRYPLRDLTNDELERARDFGYVKFEAYPESERPLTGRYWTQAQLESKACGGVTRMSEEIAQTYARDPHFYGSTYCVHCKKHLPVGEFLWDDGSGQRVGS